MYVYKKYVSSKHYLMKVCSFDFSSFMLVLQNIVSPPPAADQLPKKTKRFINLITTHAAVMYPRHFSTNISNVSSLESASRKRERRNQANFRISLYGLEGLVD